LNKNNTAIIIFIIGFLFFTITEESMSDVHFDRLNGTDLGMGTGARAIGFGGAFTAVSDDASAAFWNPAGLSQLKNSQVLLSYDLPNEFSSAILIFKPPLNALRKMNLTIGLSRINRLKIKGDSGSDDTWDGYPSNVLDMSMIEVGEGFSGSLNSKTHDDRISLSFSWPTLKALSIGVNVVSIE
jgi:hypothetical protein